MAVAALAGRRVDPVGFTPARFPFSNINRVSQEIEQLLTEEQIDHLVCSAASGADLLALKAAQKLGIRCRVILPFEIARFRKSSVVDRSGEWGVVFDSVVNRVQAVGDLVLLNSTHGSDDAAYGDATKAILREARSAAEPGVALAVLIWDGKSRGENDFTEQFKRLALQAGMRERVIFTR